ncbi:MAG: hypothetical protein H3C38_08505 [Rhodospirillales bacterium]|nr:hypothetical protein [Rhodospirillales bacterium]
MTRQPNVEYAAFIEMEKKAKQRYDRALAAFKNFGAGQAEAPHDISLELEHAKREWEATRKRIDALRAESSGS